MLYSPIAYYYDLIRWEHLTEKIAYERRVRENKLKAALQITRKQNAEFVDMVDKAKIEKFVEQRQQGKKREREEGEDADVTRVKLDSKEGEISGKKKAKKGFHQVKPISVYYGENEVTSVGKDTLRTIFIKDSS